MIKRRAVVFSIAALVAGCGDDAQPDVTIRDDTTSTTRSTEIASTTTPESLTTTTLPEPEESVRELVSVLDGDTPFEEVLATANELTEPGSPAHGYALYQAAQSQAIVLSGSPGVSASQRVTPDGGIESCQEVNGERQCATFDDFVATSSGRIVEFSVNGQSIAGRVAVQLGDSASVHGATVTLRGAIEFNTSDGLGVALEIAAGDTPLAPLSTSATAYVDPSGQQFDASFNGIGGFNDIASGARTVTIVSFGGGSIGGRIVSELCTADYDCAPFELVVA